MSAIVGSAGLKPTMAAIKAGATIAIANKESLVCAGPVVTSAAARHGVRLLPVDSEHNTIFQCFDHDWPRRVGRVCLTAHGGPFRHAGIDEMHRPPPDTGGDPPGW